MRNCVVTAAVVLAVAVFPGVALASFPGHNGRIALGLDHAGNVDVWSAALRGRPMRRLTVDPGFDACPAYSADGRRIAFCSNRSGSLEIWAMDEYGYAQRQVTHLDGFATFPDWSPDGSRIAFTWSASPDAPSGIYTIAADGSDVQPLTPATTDRFAVYSPDGSKLAFVSDRSGQSQVWVMDADGHNARRLTFSDAPHDQLPDWSPDGTRIAYQEVDALGQGHVWVMMRTAAAHASSRSATVTTSAPRGHRAVTRSPSS